MSKPARKLTKKPRVQKLGKALAREQFSPLVESLASNGGVIEITDYGKVAAVMLGYQDYMFLIAQSESPFAQSRQLRGSAQLIGDLEELTQATSKAVLASVEKTVAEL